MQAGFAVFAFGVEVALDNVELFVHFGQAAFGLNQNQTVHTVGNVHAHRRGGAVVDIQAGLQCFEAERSNVAGSGKGGFGTTAGTGYRVEVHIVRNGRVGTVGKLHFYGIAVAYTDHRTGNAAVEGPVFVLDAVSHFHDFFLNFHFHHHFGGMVTLDGRRRFGRMGHHRIDHFQLIFRNFGLVGCGYLRSGFGSGSIGRSGFRRRSDRLPGSCRFGIRSRLRATRAQCKQGGNQSCQKGLLLHSGSSL